MDTRTRRSSWVERLGTGPHRRWPHPGGSAREGLSYDLDVPNHPTRDDIDLLAGEFYSGDPHEAWTWMRANAPVYYDERNDVWAVTTYATVMANIYFNLFDNPSYMI